MRKKKFLVGGPSNSGKSTLVHCWVEWFRERGSSARAIELDVWSNSYPSFQGVTPFEGRQKRTDLHWDWKTALRERMAAFRASDSDVTFGDMPGKLGRACTLMCRELKPDGAIVVSRTLEGLEDWKGFFADFDIPIVLECISLKKARPQVVAGLHRVVDASHPDAIRLAQLLMGGEGE